MSNGSTVTKKWYEVLPWWGWLITGVVSSVISGSLGSGFIAAGFGFFMIFAFIAMIVTIISSIKASKRKNRPASFKKNTAPASDSIYEKVDEFSKSVGGISFQATQNLSSELSIPTNKTDRLLLDLIGYCLYLTYHGIDEAKLPKNIYKEVIQNIAKNVAMTIADSDHAESEYRIIMTAFQDFSRRYASKDTDAFIDKVTSGIINEYCPAKQEDFFAMTQIDMTLSNIAQSLDARSFARSLR